MFIEIKFSIEKHSEMFFIRVFYWIAAKNNISMTEFLSFACITSCAYFKGLGLKINFH